MNEEQMKRIQEMVDRLNSTTSTNEKKDILKDYPDLQSELNFIYNPFIKYFITSDNLKKNSELSKEPETENLFQLLYKLSDRIYTGHEAIARVNGFINKNESYRELIYNIVDKDLKCRIGDSIINSVYKGLIPTFDVALANSYADVEDKVNIFDGSWFASQKLDGCRTTAMIDDKNEVTLFSRQGIEFNTLDELKKDIQNLHLEGYVLDGETCLVDENGKEDFQSIMKEIRKKNHTIKNPKYFLFDMLTIEEFLSKESKRIFSERKALLNKVIIPYTGNKLEVLNQVKIEDQTHFDAMLEHIRDIGGEGLILRKDTVYKGKRSNDLLKVKDFKDAEYIVEDIVTGPFRIINNGVETTIDTLASVVITHKGNKVNVGSGFTIEDREFFYNNPKEIIGKNITVKYFNESKNEKGNYSLRFPTFVCIREGV